MAPCRRRLRQLAGAPGDLKVLDPCCGSGHFLVAALSMLVPMRMEREGLIRVRDAVDAVLRENLHGLEIDPRCVELAAFALALAAWTGVLPRAQGGYRPLPERPHLACSGLAPNAPIRSPPTRSGIRPCDGCRNRLGQPLLQVGQSRGDRLFGLFRDRACAADRSLFGRR